MILHILKTMTKNQEIEKPRKRNTHELKETTD
jgi:hypothetical protein